MKTREISQERALVEIDRQECAVITQALNEVCNGLHIEEFATRMGAEREYVRKLLKEFFAIYNRRGE